MKISNIDVDVLVNGKSVRTYSHEGKCFVEARDGSEYAIRIQNNSSNRVLAVPSVDGLSAMDGKTADLNKSGGYILEPWQSYTVKGYRKDNDTIGSFKFVKKKKGYAASKGDTSNVGVISVAVFTEKPKPAPVPQWYPIYIEKPVYRPYPKWDYYYNVLECGQDNTFYSSSLCSNRSFEAGGEVKARQNRQSGGGTSCSASLNFCQTSSVSPEQFSASTGWGKKVEDKVINSTFEKSSSAPTIFEFLYDFKEGLESQGIILTPERKTAFPKGFPNQYAEPPKGWSGE